MTWVHPCNGLQAAQWLPMPCRCLAVRYRQHADLALAETELGLAGRGPVRRAILQPASTKAPNLARGHARMPAGQASRGAGGEHGYQEDPDEQLDQACGGGAAC